MYVILGSLGMIDALHKLGNPHKIMYYKIKKINK